MVPAPFYDHFANLESRPPLATTTFTLALDSRTTPTSLTSTTSSNTPTSSYPFYHSTSTTSPFLSLPSATELCLPLDHRYHVYSQDPADMGSDRYNRDYRPQGPGQGGRLTVKIQSWSSDGDEDDAAGPVTWLLLANEMERGSRGKLG